MWKTPTVLIVASLALMAFGIVMLASTSGIRAASLYGDPYFFIKRQSIWLVVALLSGTLASRIDYHRWRVYAPALFVATVLLLVIVLIPGLGVEVGGSRRWLVIGPLGFQPSELGKFALIVILCWWLSKERRRVGEFIRGALIPVLLMGAIVGLIFLAPDFGTALLAGSVGGAILFLGGTRIAHIMLFAFPGAALFCLAVMRDPLRLRRILAFLEPESYASTYSFQLINAIYAFTLGGMGGVGLGKSIQKQYYLPEAHTDFIFAIIGEELGAAASLGVLALFFIILICGVRISMRAPDLFGRLLASGITILITGQAMMNIAVVTGCLPTKGLPLPLISFGGSALVMLTVGLGVLVNIGTKGQSQYTEDDIRSIRSRSGGF